MDELIQNAMNNTLFQKYVINGGLLMWVLVPCSLLMLGTVLQGLIALRRGRVLPLAVMKRAVQVKSAAGRCAYVAGLAGQGAPLAQAVWLWLKDFDLTAPRPSRERLQGRLEDAIVQVTDRLYEKVGLLSTIYTVGPLLGLVGTILGLMDTFHAYAQLQTPSVMALAEGVQKALVTTFWGLSMAIPAYVAGHWLQGKIRRYERDLLPEVMWRIADAIYGEGEDEPARRVPNPGLADDESEGELAALESEA